MVLRWFGARKGESLGGAGALREPIDSNSSFPVILTPSMVFASWHSHLGCFASFFGHPLCEWFSPQMTHFCLDL